ncbi:hypothetical protein [Streptomyces sp. CT34]|uniref:hypothetical protein n=1 Tax=Streptomyces sp. CT34 TaxID=1553907 RepID=UPI0005BDA723|nr:hypothetical protein [Streptomyces sp. CT34]
MTHRITGRAANRGVGRQGARIAAVGAMGVAAAVLVVTPAFAKGGATLSAVPGTVKVGQSVHVKGQGDEDGLRYGKFCVQDRVGTHGAWHAVKCGRIVEFDGGGVAKADVKVKATHRGMLQFRGVLYIVDGPRGGHPTESQTAEIRTVQVH